MCLLFFFRVFWQKSFFFIFHQLVSLNYGIFIIFIMLNVCFIRIFYSLLKFVFKYYQIYFINHLQLSSIIFFYDSGFHHLLNLLNHILNHYLNYFHTLFLNLTVKIDRNDLIILILLCVRINKHLMQYLILSL